MLRSIPAALALVLLGCPQQVSSGDDAGLLDAGRGVVEDAGLDGGAPDGGADAGPDAGSVDAGRDGGADAGPDAGSVDAGRDGGADAGPAPFDAGHCGYLAVARGASGLVAGWAQPVCLDGWCWVNPLPFGLPLRKLSGSGPHDVWAVTRDTARVAHFDGGRWDTWSPDGLFGTVASAGPGHAWLDQGQELVEVRGAALQRFDSGSAFNGDLWASGEDLVAVFKGADPQNNGAANRLQRDGGFFTVLAPSAGVIDGTSLLDFWVAQSNSIAHGPGFIPVTSGGTPPALGVPGNAIASLAADGASRGFWAGTDGVFQWNGAAWSRVTSIPPGATEVHRAASGAIWAGSGDVYRLLPASSTWQALNAPLPSPVLWAADDNEAWTSGEQGLSRHTAAGWEVPSSVGATDLMSSWFASAQDGWAGDLNGGLFRWDGARWTQAGYCAPGPFAPAFTSLHGTASDDVWAAGQSALLHFDGGSWAAVEFPLDQDGGLAYASGVVAAGRNDVWLLTATALHHFDGQGWSTAAVPFIAQDAHLLWSPSSGLSAFTDGLWHFDGGAWAQTPLPFPESIAQATIAVDGTVWLITRIGGVWKGAATGPWVQLPVAAVSSLRSNVFAFSADEAVLQSAGAPLRVFGDGGVSTQRLPFAPMIYTVVPTSTDVWAFGEWGTILRRPR